MSFCTSEILSLASGIYADINSPTSTSVGFISGVLTSSGFLGGLNDRLSCSFWISSGSCIEGGFGDTESNIAALVYRTNYWGQQAAQVLQSAGLGYVTSMADGDMRFQRANPHELSKAYLGLKKDVQEQLYVAVANFKVSHSSPVSIDAAQMASWPSP